MLLSKILLRIYILSVLPITVTGTNSSQTGLIALLNSEDPVRNSESMVNASVDLDSGSCNQVVEHAFKIPKYRPKKRKHNPEIGSESQFPKRHRITKKKLQDSFLGTNTIGYLGEFRHELPNTFLLSKNFFDLESFDLCLICNGSVLIEKFCSKTQLQHINPDVFLTLDEIIENNFDKLEIYAKRVISEYVEIFKHKCEDRSKRHSSFYISLNKALDPARTKGFYYLLIYSLYETGLIGVPRCMAVVEKIFINIITHTRLMAYMHNDRVKEEIRFRKLYKSPFVPSKMSKSGQTRYSTLTFSYTDFTKALLGSTSEKYDLFLKNADLMKKEINDNIQLIINEEFGDNPGYKKTV